MHLADFSVGMLGANGVVGGGFNIATGAALAIKQRHGSEVAVCFFGDGASSRGTFHEAVNFAASFKLPVVFVCENNSWASTTRFDDIKNVDYLSSRAQGYGIPGVTVDGNDVESVLRNSRKLIDRARKGLGPSLLECRSYRIDGHFTTDPQRYRSQDEVDQWRKFNDPIDRFTNRMITLNILDQSDLDQMDERVEQELRDALEFARTSPEPDPAQALEDIYSGEVVSHE